MSTNTYIAIGIVVLAVLGGFFFLQGGALPEVPQGTVGEETGATGEEPGVAVPRYVVVYTDAGFTPQELTVSLGETVLFQNQSAGEMWVASAMHPTHEVYPGSGITKCGTAEEGRIFDACSPISQGGTYSFNFQEQGTWAYHDHLNPERFGRIIVQ
ncbi:MAG: hypothetical protein Q8P12_02095 [bacterium]|nr:hypothetical protein [bacterium]